MADVLLTQKRLGPPLPDLASLKALNTTNINDGVIEFVKTNGICWLNKSSTATPNDINIVQPTTGPGRWFFSTYPLNNVASGEAPNTITATTTLTNPAYAYYFIDFSADDQQVNLMPMNNPDSPRLGSIIVLEMSQASKSGNICYNDGEVFLFENMQPGQFIIIMSIVNTTVNGAFKILSQPDQFNFVTVGGAFDVTLTNPLPNIIRVEFTTPDRKLILPPMNEFNSAKPGESRLIFNDSVQPFSLYANDEETLIHGNLLLNQWLTLTVADNLDANGGFNFYVLGSMSRQESGNVNINGGTIDNVFLGNVVPIPIGRFNLLRATDLNPGKSFARQAVKAASTANLTATYNNGSSGAGATLTNSGMQSALVLDGYACQIDDRVLVKDQTTKNQNGIYIVTWPGGSGTDWILTRATDFDNSLGGEITQGITIFVSNGTVNGGQEFYQTVSGTIVIGTNNIIFAPTYLPKQITGTHNTEWRGLWATDQIGNIAYTLLPNNRVRLAFPEVLAIGDGSIDKIRNNTLLPTFLRPPGALPVEAVIRTQVSASPVVNTYGLLLIQPSGQISIASGPSNEDFPGSTLNTGFHPVEVEYNLT